MQKDKYSTETMTLFLKDHAFDTLVFCESYSTSTTQLIKQITPANFPYTLHVAPFYAETPLHLCVAKQPLGVVLEQIAALLDAQWREETNGSTRKTYVLEPKPDTLTREKALYTATLDLNAEPMMQTARSAARRSANYWQKEFKKVQTVGPKQTYDEMSPESRLQYLARPDGKWYAFLTLLAGLSRTQRRTLTEKGYMVFLWSAMNAVQRQNTLASRHSDTRPNPHNAYDLSPEENRKAERLEMASVRQFGLVLSAEKDPVSGRVIAAGPSVGIHQGSIRFPTTGDNFVLPVRGNPYLFDPDAPKPGTKPPTDAALETAAFPPDVRFTQTDTWADVLQTLAQKLPYCLVSDAYTAARLCAYPTPENGDAVVGDLAKMNLVQALDALCTAYHYLWWYEPGKNNVPGTLFFRSRAWFVEKRYEPPASAIAKTVAAIQSTEKPWESVAVVDSAVGLTLEQMQGIAGRQKAAPWGLGPDFARGYLFAFMEGNGPQSACAAFYWLQFWSRLSPEQKQQMVNFETGLPGNRLSAEQQTELLQNLFVSAALEVPLTAQNIAWNTVRIHVYYSKKADEDFPPNAPALQFDYQRPTTLRLVIQGIATSGSSGFALPVALGVLPQPKKIPPAKPA